MKIFKMMDAVQNGNIFEFARYENGIYYYQLTRLMQVHLSDKNSGVYRGLEKQSSSFRVLGS